MITNKREQNICVSNELKEVLRDTLELLTAKERRTITKATTTKVI